jgi:hypothetical protein
MPKARAKRLSKVTAIQMADEMLTHVQREVYWGLENEVAMEGANEVIQNSFKGVTFYGANTVNVMSSALAIELSLVLAKLYEIPRPKHGQSAASKHNKSDVASIPLLLRLLRQKQCRDHYVKQSLDWKFGLGKPMNGRPGAVSESLDRLLARYSSARKNRRYQDAMRRIREFRNNRVAHAIMVDPRQPIYNDLHILMDLSRDTLQDLRLAMKGEGVDLLEKEGIRKAEATHFWEAALPAVVLASDPR